MDRLFKSILSIREFKFRTDDDYCDRLSRQDYTNQICWVSNTYYLPIEEVIPRPGEELALKRSNALISYYQWVPLILMFQGLLSFTPCLVWRFLNKRSGINVSTVMDAATVCQQASYLEIREKTIRYIVNQMDRYLLAQRDYRTGCCVRLKHLVAKLCCLVGGRMYGNYLTTAYLIVKALYVTNAIGQLFMLDLFMGGDYHMYGIYVINRLFRGLDWSASSRFPRVTLCDFEIRHQARVHSYIVQCVLSINLFNEKIFLFIWFWYVFVSSMTVFNFVRWLVRALYWPGQVNYVRKQLRAFETTQREPAVVSKFTENYLRRDGLFLLRLIALNVGEVVAGEALCGLWNNYSPERRLIAEKPGRKHGGKPRQNGGQRMEIV